MNATSLDQLRSATSQSDRQDEKMDQIRDLLVGDIIRQAELRMAEMERRLDEMETAIGSRLSALHARLEALSGEVSADRRSAFDELARSVLELGQQIHRISRD